MKRFIIEELVTYEVAAKDEVEALEIFLNAEDANAFFLSVEEREVYEG